MRSISFGIGTAGILAVVRMFTKDGCSLCDDVVAVLEHAHRDLDFAFETVDIADTRNEEWCHRYKFDIPVVHLNGRYWAKHRLSDAALRTAVRDGAVESKGEPDARRLRPL